MSPEGVPSKAADVFALGLTLFELLVCDSDAGRIPMTVPPGTGAGGKHFARDTPAILAMTGLSAGRLGDAIPQLLASMMASNPAARPPAAEIEAVLRALTKAPRTEL